MKKSLVAVALLSVFLLAACVHTDEQSQKTTEATATTVAQGTESSQGTTTAGTTVAATETAVTTVVTETPTTETTVAVQGSRKKLLSVTPQIQEKWYFSVPTTVSMMLSTQGIIVSQEQLAKEMGTYEPYGTHNKEAIRVLNQHLFGYPEPKLGKQVIDLRPSRMPVLIPRICVCSRNEFARISTTVIRSITPLPFRRFILGNRENIM